MAAEDAHGSVAVPYRWDQCFMPHGTGVRESCMRPARVGQFWSGDRRTFGDTCKTLQ
jgi:hypothetical protein